MALDLNKALLLPFLSVLLALSFPCRAAAAAAAWPPGRNLSVAAAAAAAPTPPCDASAGGCRIADLRPELEGMADPGMLGASLAAAGGGSPLDQKFPGCGRNSRNRRSAKCRSIFGDMEVPSSEGSSNGDSTSLSKKICRMYPTFV